MHSFQPSRGRVLLEVLLALGMAASLAGAWIQSGASALLAAAGVAALYGLIHLFDMRRPKPAISAEPQRIDFDDEVERKVALHQDEAVRPPAEDQPSAAGTPTSTPDAKTGSNGKVPRKAARRPKAAKAAKLKDPVVLEVTGALGPLAHDQLRQVELAPPADANAAEFAFVADQEPVHPHIEPLFEPEPFARMPRRAFGRRGRI